MNSVMMRVLVFLISVFILITVFSQVYHIFDNKYKTETAYVYSSAESAVFKGVYIRKETPVPYSGRGVVSYTSPDGSKFSKDSVIAEVYNNENQISVNQQIKELTEERDLLLEVQNPGTVALAEPDFLSERIDEKYRTITSLIAKKQYDEVEKERNELMKLMCILRLAVETETDYNDRINTLDTQINSLQARQTAPVEEVTVSEGGYFVSYIDGYETELSPDKLNSLTVSRLKEITSDKSEHESGGYIGKMIDGYKWNMAGIIDNSEGTFTVSSEVKLNLSSSKVPVSAVIEDIIASDNPHESIVILSCDVLTYDLVQHRTERVELVLNDFEGIKVPNEAIRFNRNNERGVYVKLGQRIAFKKIDSVFDGEDYILSRITSDGSYLAVYEDIIVEGVNTNEFLETEDEINGSDTTAETTGGSEPESAESTTETAVSESSSGSSETAA